MKFLNCFVLAFAFLVLTGSKVVGQKKAEQIQYLIDRQAIEDVIKKYALSIDRRDWEMQKSLFTDPYTSLKKGKEKEANLENRIKFLDKFTDKYLWTQHIASIYTVDLEGDEAYVISTINANHKGRVMEDGKKTKDLHMIGQYRYWLKRLDGGWKIYKMSMVRNAKMRMEGKRTVNNKELEKED